MSRSFKTLKGISEGVYREKGSKFLGYAEPVSSEKEAMDRVAHWKEVHPDASHHCFAYSIGVPEPIRWEQDDGEPSGTAGRPILNAIRSHQLDDLIVTVVRYFGGSKLGKRGLIDAYRLAAERAIEAGEITEERLLVWIEVEHEHASTGAVESLIRKLDAEKRQEQYGEKARFFLGLPPETKDVAIQELRGLSGVKAELLENEE